ncbi:MAG: hypothetical protein JOY64_28955 [Alphaproteobacteria bacterium]|nr:hypothetical protein [Alphaproteobacteria bacterium]MBV8411691.1 hypothetical protein [Alphaproteobacteria bacterium]
MPLFFIIAIGAGALALGATTADVTGSAKQNSQARAAQAQQTTFQASAYATYDDCVRAAMQQQLPASACQR